MLQCELRFRGDVNMAMRMHELLPNKTLKQLRDKRREASFVRRRDLLYAQRAEELRRAEVGPLPPEEHAQHASLTSLPAPWR